MILVAFVILIVLDAVGDAVKSKPQKHLFEALHILGWLMLPVFLYQMYEWHWVLFPDFLEMIVIYSLLRYFLFDGVWNAIRRQKIAYIGSTSYYDKILSQVHPSFVLYTKLLAAMVAVALTFT